MSLDGLQARKAAVDSRHVFSTSRSTCSSIFHWRYTCLRKQVFRHALQPDICVGFVTMNRRTGDNGGVFGKGGAITKMSMVLPRTIVM